LTIALAATGWGVWAPVVGNTAHGLFQWIGASIAKPMRPKLVVTTPAFPTRVRFGLKAGIANATYELYRNVDYLIVGRLLGVGPLGIYRVAFDLAMAPVLAVVQVAQRTALPVFSRIADEREGLADAFMYTSRSLALLLVPIVALLYFAGGDLLWWIGGDKWLSAAPALGLLAWAALPRALTHLYPLLLYARGRPGLAAIEALFHLGFLVVVLSVALTMFGDQLGVIAACYAWLVAAPVMLGFDWWLVRRVVRLRVRGYLAALRDPLLGMLLLGLGLWALSSIAPALPEGGIRFGLQLLVGLGLYALFLRGFLHIDPKRLLRSDPAS
jgi:O-antigen/teichoic acid export membrane protein